MTNANQNQNQNKGSQQGQSNPANNLSQADRQKGGEHSHGGQGKTQNK